MLLDPFAHQIGDYEHHRRILADQLLEGWTVKLANEAGVLPGSFGWLESNDMRDGVLWLSRLLNGFLLLHHIFHLSTALLGPLNRSFLFLDIFLLSSDWLWLVFTVVITSKLHLKAFLSLHTLFLHNKTFLLSLQFKASGSTRPGKIKWHIYIFR